MEVGYVPGDVRLTGVAIRSWPRRGGRSLQKLTNLSLNNLIGSDADAAKADTPATKAASAATTAHPRRIVFALSSSDVRAATGLIGRLRTPTVPVSVHRARTYTVTRTRLAYVILIPSKEGDA